MVIKIEIFSKPEGSFEIYENEERKRRMIKIDQITGLVSRQRDLKTN